MDSWELLTWNLTKCCLCEVASQVDFKDDFNHLLGGKTSSFVQLFEIAIFADLKDDFEVDFKVTLI